MDDTAFLEEINGKKIFSIFSKSNTKSKNLVIMNHGFKGNSSGSSRTFVNFSRILTAKDISVLRFDQPNSGNSEGDFIDSSFNEWVETIVYFVKKYLVQGYKIVLLGHSMGANASLVAATNSELKNKISTLLLWAPDPKTESIEWFVKETKKDETIVDIYEEAGQKYRASFWEEVKNADFFDCLQQYTGKIHLVYGETDKFVSEKLRKRVIEEVKNKEQEVMILKGQDHSSWDFDLCQQVYSKELEILKKQFT